MLTIGSFAKVILVSLGVHRHPRIAISTKRDFVRDKVAGNMSALMHRIRSEELQPRFKNA